MVLNLSPNDKPDPPLHGPMLHEGLVVSLLKMPMDWHSSKQRSCTRPFRNDHCCTGVLYADEVQDFLFFKRWTLFNAFLADGPSRSTTTPFEEESVIARLFLLGRKAGGGWTRRRRAEVRSPHSLRPRRALVVAFALV